MKTLAIIIENYVAGGANKYTEDVIFCLQSEFSFINIYGNKDALKSFSKERLPTNVRFHEITIYNAGEMTKNFTTTKRKLLRFLFIPIFFLFNLFSILKLNLEINSLKPNLIILCNGGYPASIYLDLATIFINSEFSISMTIVSAPTRKNNFFLNIFWNFLDKKVSENCKKIVVNSIATKDALCSMYNFPRQKVFVLKNGISSNFLKRASHSPKITIGFISRIEESKGIIETLSAYKALKKKYHNISLLIAGSGSLSVQVEAACSEDPSITYLGYVNSGLSELLHSIDIYVLPSHHEGLPYSIIEASMAGCAIIASNVGGIPEIIKDGYSGVLIPPQNKDALYSAIKQLILDEKSRNTYSLNAKKNFIENLSIDKMTDDARKIFL